VNNKLVNYFFNLLFSGENDLTSKAKLSADEVSKIALDFGKKENWLPQRLQKVPILKLEGKKLLWRVNFDKKQREDFSVLGDHKYLIIDDETREVKKFVGIR
jgi:hypothetical protein